MFISKRDLEDLHREDKELKDRLYKMEGNLYAIAKAAGIEWVPSEPGKWIKKC